MKDEPNGSVFVLPRWDALPELDLYMDQLISLLEKYLEYEMKDFAFELKSDICHIDWQ